MNVEEFQKIVDQGNVEFMAWCRIAEAWICEATDEEDAVDRAEAFYKTLTQNTIKVLPKTPKLFWKVSPQMRDDFVLLNKKGLTWRCAQSVIDRVWPGAFGDPPDFYMMGGEGAVNENFQRWIKRMDVEIERFEPK